jgi:ankyrin repeat protein
MSTEFLQFAAAGDLHMVQILLREKPERIVEHGTNGFTAVLLAARMGRIATVKWLLSGTNRPCYTY